MNDTERYPPYAGMPLTRPTGGRKKKIIWISIAVVAVVAVGVPAWILASAQRGVSCLTINDFTDLTGDRYVSDEFDPKESFHDYSFEFLDASPGDDESTTVGRVQVIDDVATFYKSHKNASIEFTIRSYSTDHPSKVLAEKRRASVKNDLVAAGIPDSQIKQVNTVVDITSAGDIGDDGFDEDTNSIVLSITSNDSCQ